MSDTNLRKIGPLAPTHRDIDMRAVTRHSCPNRPQVRVAVRPTFLPTAVLVKDISTRGAGLLVEGHLAPGTCLALPWMYGPPERWRTLRLTVVHLSPRSDGGWVAGRVFEEPLEPREVEEFLKHGHRP